MDHNAAVNPIMRNSKGQLLTPVDAAVARGHKGCAQFLQLHGATSAAKLTDKRALQLALSKAMEGGSGDRTGATPNSELGYQDLLIPSSATPGTRTQDASTLMAAQLKDMGTDTQTTSEINIQELVVQEPQMAKVVHEARAQYIKRKQEQQTRQEVHQAMVHQSQSAQLSDDEKQQVMNGSEVQKSDAEQVKDENNEQGDSEAEIQYDGSNEQSSDAQGTGYPNVLENSKFEATDTIDMVDSMVLGEKEEYSLKSIENSIKTDTLENAVGIKEIGQAMTGEVPTSAIGPEKPEKDKKCSSTREKLEPEVEVKLEGENGTAAVPKLEEDTATRSSENTTKITDPDTREISLIVPQGSVDSKDTSKNESTGQKELAKTSDMNRGSRRVTMSEVTESKRVVFVPKESGYSGSHRGDSELDNLSEDEGDIVSKSAIRRKMRKEKLQAREKETPDYRSDQEETDALSDRQVRKKGGRYNEDGDMYDLDDAYADMDDLPRHLSARRAAKSKGRRHSDGGETVRPTYLGYDQYVYFVG
ncbi:hypothetical protein HAZT_HAZT001021 [Hyalella azteca]|uniref:Uncharacterized protein n=1 Tax=Hyalella azteca TaxID=294128 RepID=A0A6A0H4M4_HYAAZ|nr:hypothetical protein HAZT_HAZT001021 [Hyalella azteca]